MANPTTNYSFVLPTSSDLVTDLPADFDIALQGVDTRLKALQPGTTAGDLAYSSATANTNVRLGIGTTGQMLSVVAGVPAWVNGTTGDIEGVTAGTGISGGGTSGTVTVTNSMATAIDAKGDLIVGTGADAFSRLAVGATNGTVLTVDSAEATGLKYAKFIQAVRKSSDQTVTSSTTLVNDSQLKFSVGANETFYFQAWLYVFAADGTPDIKVTFTGPAGSTVLYSTSQIFFLPDASTTATVVNTSGVTSSIFVDSNLRAIQLYGTILNGGTAGDLQFQFAQNTSSANGTSVKAGSAIIGIKV